MQKSINIACVAVAAAVACASQAKAADIGVATLKYIAIDKETAAGKSKTVFVSKDALANKGGNDVEDIAVTFNATYVGESGTASAQFDLVAGTANGWLVNKDSVAKFVNKDAPAGPSGAKVAVIKPGKLLKLIGKTRGDSQVLDLIAAGAPTGSLYTAYSVDASGQTDTFCSEFSGCVYKVIGGGTGRKLVCKGGVADATCAAAAPPPVACVGGSPNGTIEGSEECDDGDVDPTNGCTNDCTICGDGIVTAPEACDPPGGGCAVNCQPVGCGNGLVEAPETCDDGNTDDGDSCPSNCIIETCDPTGGTVTATVSFSGSVNVAGIQVYIDYPENKVEIPGAGDAIPFGTINNLQNAFANGQSNDLDYALRQAWVDTAPFTPDTGLFEIVFNTCTAGAAVDGDFTCVVEAAGDTNAVEIPGVTCSVDVP